MQAALQPAAISEFEGGIGCSVDVIWRLKGALAAITAAVVGVILNLAIWFALHVFFGMVTLNEIGPLKVWTPTFSSLDWRVVALSALSALLLLKQHWSIPSVLGAASTLALIIRFLGI